MGERLRPGSVPGRARRPVAPASGPVTEPGGPRFRYCQTRGRSVAQLTLAVVVVRRGPRRSPVALLARARGRDACVCYPLALILTARRGLRGADVWSIACSFRCDRRGRAEWRCRSPETAEIHARMACGIGLLDCDLRRAGILRRSPLRGSHSWGARSFWARRVDCAASGTSAGSIGRTTGPRHPVGNCCRCSRCASSAQTREPRSLAAASRLRLRESGRARFAPCGQGSTGLHLLGSNPQRRARRPANAAYLRR